MMSSTGAYAVENTVQDIKSMAFAAMEEIEIEPTPDRVKGFLKYYSDRASVAASDFDELQQELGKVDYE